MGAQKNHLKETVLLSTKNICKKITDKLINWLYICLNVADHDVCEPNAMSKLIFIAYKHYWASLLSAQSHQHVWYSIIQNLLGTSKSPYFSNQSISRSIMHACLLKVSH